MMNANRQFTGGFDRQRQRRNLQLRLKMPRLLLVAPAPCLCVVPNWPLGLWPAGARPWAGLFQSLGFFAQLGTLPLQGFDPAGQAVAAALPGLPRPFLAHV